MLNKPCFSSLDISTRHECKKKDQEQSIVEIGSAMVEPLNLCHLLGEFNLHTPELFFFCMKHHNDTYKDFNASKLYIFRDGCCFQKPIKENGSSTLFKIEK